MKVLLFLFLFIATANSEYIDPGTVAIKTDEYRPEKTYFENAEYSYAVSWEGIPVAKAKVNVENQESSLKVKTEARTKKWLSAFYKLKFSGESEFDSRKFKPKEFNFRQIEKSKKKVRSIKFSDDGSVLSRYFKNGVEQKKVEFSSGNQTLDPITAAFLARSLPLSKGIEKSFDVFTGKHRYLIKFNVKERETIRVNDKDYLCYRVIPEVRKLTDSQGEKRLNSASIWITADDKREIVKLESSVFLGSITAKLVSNTKKELASIKKSIK